MKREYYIKTIEGTTYYGVHYDGRLVGSEEFNGDDFFKSLSEHHRALLTKLGSNNLETRVEIK